MPLQSVGTSCPTTYNSAFTGYYTASTYKGTTTIAGAVAQRFDSDYNHKTKTVGDATPGFDLTQLKICIQLPTSSTSGTSAWSYLAGDSVTVYLYYPFQPVSALFGRVTLNLVASSQYEVE
jgi:hypothetical protein